MTHEFAGFSIVSGVLDSEAVAETTIAWFFLGIGSVHHEVQAPDQNVAFTQTFDVSRQFAQPFRFGYFRLFPDPLHGDGFQFL